MKDYAKHGKPIIIWRHQLFKPSEHFIIQQALTLKNFSPLLVGGRIMDEPQYNINHQVVSYRFFNWFSLLYNPSKSDLYRKINELKPALIHAHFCVDASMILPIAHACDLPLVVTCHGFDASVSRKAMFMSGKLPWIWHAMREKKLAKHADKFICVSSFIRNKMLQRGYPEDKLITHYIGIDIEKDKPDIKTSKHESPLIFCAARLTEQKGIKYLLRAFKKTLTSIPEATLAIAGNGPLEKELKRQVVKLGIEKNVIFLGMISHSEVLNWMKKSWVFCLPSVTAENGDAEGLGMVLLEAQVAEVPVVASNSGGIPEAIEDGKSGFLVPEMNSDELAEKLLFLIKNETESVKMGKQGRIIVENRFNIHKQTKKLEKIYSDL